MINEDLDLDKIGQRSALTDFQISVVLKSSEKRDFLLDVGSGSGRFLLHASRHFKQTYGIEVSPECVEFSQKKLGLQIADAVPNISEKLNVATFWHSLEHISFPAIETLFEKLLPKLASESHTIISVPNARSLQARMFGKLWPYYDPPHHVHQFSRTSLLTLLDRFGFELHSEFYSFAYSFFGFLQGFLNVFNRHRNYIYFRKKRGWTFGLSPWKITFLDLYNLALAAGLAAPAMVFCAYEYLNLKNNGVITLCLRIKKPSSS